MSLGDINLVGSVKDSVRLQAADVESECDVVPEDEIHTDKVIKSLGGFLKRPSDSNIHFSQLERKMPQVPVSRQPVSKVDRSTMSRRQKY